MRRMDQWVSGKRNVFAAMTWIALGSAALVASAADSKGKKKEPPPPKSDETVASMAYVVSSELKVEGVGLVVGLDNTGSEAPPSWYRTQILDEMRKSGIEHPEKFLSSKTTSIVIVKASIPAGVTTKDRFDVEVDLPPASGTTSLAGGYLMVTQLGQVINTAAGPKSDTIMAAAGGSIMVGNQAKPNDTKVGRVLGGGRAKKDIPYSLVIRDNRKSIRTSKMIENAIKVRFHQIEGVDSKGMATAKTDQLLVLKVPKVYHHNQSRYFEIIRHLPIVTEAPLRAQRLETWGKELLDSKKSGVAALKLEGMGPSAVPTLKNGLTSPDAQVKFFSAEALAYLGDSSGADVLSDTAIKRPEFRSYALKALAAMDQSAGLMRLRNLMAQADTELRYGAFDALRTQDANDPFLGQIAVFDAPVQAEVDEPDAAMTLQISGESKNRRKPRRAEPFTLYVVDCEGPPMIHVARNLRTEVVIFGKNQRLLTPVVLGQGGAILVNASEADNQLQISKIVAGEIDAPGNRVNCSLDVADAIRHIAQMNASYPEVVNILVAAFQQKNLPGPLVVDAIPLPTKSYSEAQLLGQTEKDKKDEAVKKASAEAAEKKPGLFRRMFTRKPAEPAKK